MKNPFPKRTFMLGGASSGKSVFAEALVVSSGLPKTYIATTQAFDDEMRAKIDRHKKMRGAGWTTVEPPLDPTHALDRLGAQEIAIVDCATMWLSNHFLADNDLASETARLTEAVDRCAGAVVIVSNEVGHGIVPDNHLARQFRDAQGRLNIALAAQADLAVLVVAGLPLILKGQLP